MLYPAPYWAALDCHDGAPYVFAVETEGVVAEPPETEVFATSKEVTQSHPTRTHLDIGILTMLKPEHMPVEYQKLFLDADLQRRRSGQMAGYLEAARSRSVHSRGSSGEVKIDCTWILGS
eukprot:2710600-Amphidinium_carterae.1